MTSIPLLRNPIFYIWITCTLILASWEIYLHYSERGVADFTHYVHQQKGSYIQSFIHHIGVHGGVIDNLHLGQIRERSYEDAHKGLRRLVITEHTPPQAPADFPHHQYITGSTIKPVYRPRTPVRPTDIRPAQKVVYTPRPRNMRMGP